MFFITNPTNYSTHNNLPGILSSKFSSEIPAYDNKENLHYYFAGLIEGDVSFNVPKIIKDSNGKKRVAGIEIIGNIKDRPAFEFLQSIYGSHPLRPCKAEGRGRRKHLYYKR